MRSVPVYPYSSTQEPMYWVSCREAHEMVEKTKKAVFLSRRGEPMMLQLCSPPRASAPQSPAANRPFAGSVPPVITTAREMRVIAGLEGNSQDRHRARTRLTRGDRQLITQMAATDLGKLTTYQQH